VIDHDATDELLAGYVLGSLSGEDAAEVDRLLAEHVPECPTCRATLDAFQGLTGEIGMAAPPSSPPETLLPRLHRSLDGGRRRGLPAWSPTRFVAAAAAAVVVVGAAGLVISERAGSPPEQQLLSQADLATVKEFKADPDSQISDIDGRATEVVPQGLEELYVIGSGIETPPAGLTYRLWTVNEQGETWVGDFVPVNGRIVLRVAVDPSTVDDLLVTLEPADSEASQPGEPAWDAAA
jgi:anti-sigma-K factor RskA